MELSQRIRRIDAVRLHAQAAARTTFFFRARQEKTILGAVFCAALLTCGIALAAQRHAPPAGAARMPPSAPAWDHGPHRQYGRTSPGPRPHGEHLPQWYRQHQNLSAQEQERALRAEPGFNRLPSWRQQRLFERLRQLNAMPPLQRERTLQRMEALERLSPEQRVQVRAAVQEITTMPVERRRRMRDAFQTLSEAPPPQRQALLNSAEYKRRFSPHELQMLSILMTVEPYTPPPAGPGMMYSGPPR